jgi:hypothetical protein
MRQKSDDKDLEEAQRKAEEDFDRQVVEDARQDVEVRLTMPTRTQETCFLTLPKESMAQSEADIQEAVQEVQPPRRTPPLPGCEKRTAPFPRIIRLIDFCDSRSLRLHPQHCV